MGTKSKLKATSYDEQCQRRFISDNWEPNGFDRYPHMRKMKESMSVFGGIGDNGGTDPDRFRAIDSNAEDFPVKQ